MKVTVEFSDDVLADLLEESGIDDPAAAIHDAVLGHIQWLSEQDKTPVCGRAWIQDGKGGVIKEWPGCEPEPEPKYRREVIEDAA